MEESRRRSRTVWIVAGLVILGLIVVLAGPLSSLGDNGRTESLFAEPPETGALDAEALEALGSFEGEGEADAAVAAAAAEADAEEDSAATAGGEATDSSDSIIGGNVSNFSTADIFDLIWRLGLVAAIVWGSIFVLRKYVGRKARVSSESGALKVLETVGLGSNRLVYLLEAGDRVLVVGTTPNHIALLAELDDPEVVSALRADAERTSPTVATLGEMMRGVSSRLGFMRPDPTKNEDGAERAARRGARPAESTLLAQLREAEREIAASARRRGVGGEADAAARDAGGA